MQRDPRSGPGIWKSVGLAGNFGWLEQGSVYGYYYVIDNATIYYDPGADHPVDHRTGTVVNVIEVPMEIPSEEDKEGDPMEMPAEEGNGLPSAEKEGGEVAEWETAVGDGGGNGHDGS